MGGLAFTSGDQPIDTPRMPPAVYEVALARCHAALRNIYVCVASPIPGPAKADYGDIDVLVALQRSQVLGEGHSSHAPLTMDDARLAIQEALGAIQFIAVKHGGHYAIPWPSMPSTPVDDTAEAGDRHVPDADESETGEIPKRYIQVDITICDTVDDMQQILFKHAHGDLWSILGSIIRPLGLTIDHQALWVRIPDIEKSNKNRAKVFLTEDPYEILNFLGLDPSDTYWERPFTSLNDMYEYAATCRLFCALPHSSQAKRSPTSTEPPSPSVPAASPSDAKDPETSATMNASDRKRMNSRPAYRKFFDEFLPQCRESQHFLSHPSTILSVRDDAFQRFQGTREMFESRQLAFICERSQEKIISRIKDEWVPAADPNNPQTVLWRGCLVKAFKKIIFDGDESYGIVPKEELFDDIGRTIEDRIERFVLGNSQEIGMAAVAKHNQAYMRRMEVKRG